VLRIKNERSFVMVPCQWQKQKEATAPCKWNLKKRGKSHHKNLLSPCFFTIPKFLQRD